MLSTPTLVYRATPLSAWIILKEEMLRAAKNTKTSLLEIHKSFATNATITTSRFQTLSAKKAASSILFPKEIITANVLNAFPVMVCWETEPAGTIPGPV